MRASRARADKTAIPTADVQAMKRTTVTSAGKTQAEQENLTARRIKKENNIINA